MIIDDQDVGAVAYPENILGFQDVDRCSDVGRRLRSARQQRDIFGS